MARTESAGDPSWSRVVGIVGFLAALVTIGGFFLAQRAQKSQDLINAEQVGGLKVQIALANTQVALNVEQNKILAQQSTVTARQAEGQGAVTRSAENGGAEATLQALDVQRQRVEATQTAVARMQEEATCFPNETPPFGGSHPLIGTQICIPAEAFAWISSDPAHVTIPGVYDNGFAQGFTFAFFGPARFTISGVTAENVRLDLRSSTDTTLLDNSDGKAVAMVYRGRKVCDRAIYDLAKACP